MRHDGRQRVADREVFCDSLCTVYAEITAPKADRDHLLLPEDGLEPKRHLFADRVEANVDRGQGAAEAANDFAPSSAMPSPPMPGVHSSHLHILLLVLFASA